LHVTLNLPGRHVSTAPATRIGAEPDPAPPPVPAMEKKVRNADILLVEDQFLIAMEAEQAIEETRIGKVRTVASVYEALKAINTRVPDVAILDVNLGGENSIAIARALRERGVPFIFATGYADRTLIPADLHDVPMERKPYCATALAEKICRILS
uniref:response regulator n=1 Tax=Komagataeibacter kakiaceti TaxID=943261 RepID=UPI00054F35FD